MFDKQWFRNNQKWMLWIANSPLKELVFNFKKMGHYPKNRIVKVTPNSVAEVVWFYGKLQLREHFFERNEYALRIRKVFYPLWMSFHIWDLFADPVIPKLSLGFNSLTVNPQTSGGGGNVSTDGFVQRAGVDEAFGTIRGGAGTNSAVADTDDLFSRIVSSGTLNQYAEITRSIYTFDTSSLGAGATISAATASFFGDGGNWTKIDTFVSNYNVYGATPANKNNLVNADYGQTGTTAYCNTAIAGAVVGWNDSGYNDFAFNATGLAAILVTGVTAISGKNANQDAANSAPTWSSSAQSRVGTIMSDNGSNKPKLVITYTPAAVSGMNHMSLLGIS